MTTLADYETQTADLLHDPNQQTWSLTQLDRYINEARRQVAADTGCLRTLQASYLTQAQEAYTYGQVCGAAITAGGSNYSGGDTVAFSGGGGSGVAATLTVSSGAVTAITFTNFGSGYTSAPTASITTSTGSGATIAVGILSLNTLEILGVNVLWGTARPALEFMPWSMFSARIRGWQNYQRLPTMWSIYGEAQLYIGPMPDQTYACEFDSTVLPADLTDRVTADTITTPYQGAVKYYAAHLAKFYDQSFGESEIFKQQYTRKTQEIASQVVSRRIPNIYQGMASDSPRIT